MNDGVPVAPGEPTRRRRGLAPLTLVYGVAVFLWLTPESDSVALAALLGVCGATIAVAHLWAHHSLKRLHGLRLPLWGALAGAGGALMAAGLMFLKTALHAHPYPDFTPLLMLAMIERAPTWGLAGALVGAGVWLLRGVFPRATGSGTG